MVQRLEVERGGNTSRTPNPELPEQTSVLSAINPVAQGIFSRAESLFNDMRSRPPTTASWLGWGASVFNPLIKLVAYSMKPSPPEVREPGLWLRFVRSAMNTCAPVLLPKPYGVRARMETIPRPRNERIPYRRISDADDEIANGVTCEWIEPNPGDLREVPIANKKVVIYLPGGGYHVGSSATHGAITGRIARDSHCRVCVLNYRLLPEHAYPAALNDLILLYNHLLAQGYKPENIVLAGDSAGGHLATSFVHYVQKKMQQENILPETPLVCALLLLISPALDFHMEDEEYREAIDPLFPAYMVPQIGRVLSRRLSSANMDRPNHPEISPVYVDLNNRMNHPPVFISHGYEEVFGVGIRRFVSKLEKSDIPVYADAGPIFHSGQIASGWLSEASDMMSKCTEVVSHALDPEIIIATDMRR